MAVTRDGWNEVSDVRELYAREQFIESILASTRDCIKVLDLDACLLYMNKGGARELELCDVEAVRGTSWIEFWSGADRDAARAAFDAARSGITTEFVGYFETMITKKPRWWHVVVGPIYDGDRVHQILAVSRDITDRKRLEDDLRRSVEAREQFLSVASHELRTPLTSLKVQLHMASKALAKTGTLPPARLERLFDVATRQLDRLAKLVESMFGVSSLYSGNLVLVPVAADLTAIVSGVYDRLRDELHEAGCTVFLDLAAALPGRWDVDRLEQVIENLLGNVIKYAPGAEVTIATRRCDHGCQVIVADRGPGVPHDKQHVIFERFERAGTARALGGLGLGLFIARQLVEAHGGRIRVEATQGGGATFIVDLP